MLVVFILLGVEEYEFIGVPAYFGEVSVGV